MKKGEKKKSEEVEILTPEDVSPIPLLGVSMAASPMGLPLAPWYGPSWPLVQPSRRVEHLGAKLVVRQACADLFDDGKNFIVHAEFPGIPKEKIRVSVTKIEVEMQAEVESKAEKEMQKLFTFERSYCGLYRKMKLPEEVVPEKAKASMKDGLLEVRIPKKSEATIKKHVVRVE